MTARTPDRRRWRRRARWFWRDWGWFLILAIALATLVLGYVGFKEHLDATGERRSFGDTLYLALQLFGLESGAVDPPVPATLEVARVLAPLVVAVALVRAIIAVSREQLRRMRVWLMRDHVVVCGLGARGVLLAQRFARHREGSWWRRLRYGVVAIEEDELADGIEECREEGVTVIVGDATEEYVLRKARLEKARYLVAVGSDDGMNAEVAADAARLVAGRRGGPLEAFIHIVDPTLSKLLRERERQTRASDSCGLRFFNVYETGARAWIDRHPPFGQPGEPPDKRAHLVVVGVGQLGNALVVGAVRNWLALHVASHGAVPAESDRRPRITLIDREAKRDCEWLHVAFPQLHDYCDLIARQMDVTSPQYRQAKFLFDAQGRPDVTAIYVCMDDDGRSLAAGLALHERLRERDDAGAVPVVVRLRGYAGLATILGEETERGDAYGNLHAFTLLDRVCTPDFLLGRTPNERLARSLHDVYVRMQERRGQTAETNASMVPWDALPESLKESNRRQADHARVKLRLLGYDYEPAPEDEVRNPPLPDDDIEPLAIMEHDRYVAERRFDGWSPGPRDPVARTSPYLVAWDELPEDGDVKDYDREFVSELPRALADAHLRMYRIADRAGRSTSEAGEERLAPV